ncbi:hypothetical protein [Rubritalea tangerina]|uniref:hypothetical protein n=1 Tax=Rubritalea tangerina TaxID=430798 RepID=UPI003608E640
MNTLISPPPVDSPTQSPLPSDNKKAQPRTLTKLRFSLGGKRWKLRRLLLEVMEGCEQPSPSFLCQA